MESDKMSTYRKQVYRTHSFQNLQEFLLKHRPEDIFDVQFIIYKDNMSYAVVYLKEIEEGNSNVGKYSWDKIKMEMK